MAVKDVLRDIARENSGVVTTRDLRERGVDTSSLRRYARGGEQLRKVVSGVYVYSGGEESDLDTSDAMLQVALRIGGENSFLYGDSVLSFYHLAYVVPHKVHVGVTRRPVRQIPQWMMVHVVKKKPSVDVMRGLRLQNLYDAFLCSNEGRTNRLFEGVETAYERGLLTPMQMDQLWDYFTEVEESRKVAA